MRVSSLLSLAALARVHAQFDTLRPDYSHILEKNSKNCSEAFVPFTMIFNTCLQMPLLMGAITKQGEYVERTDEFLTAFCADTTPECDAKELGPAAKVVEYACSKEIETNGYASLLLWTIQNFQTVKWMMCSKSVSDKFCITETYRIIETAIGRNLTRNEVIAAMNGNSTLVAELDAVVNSGALCTGCVSRLIYARTQSITSANIPNAIEPAQRKCGVKFGTLVNPEGVHVPGNATESAAKFTMPPQAVAATARVENGGTEPRGISWKRLAAPLGVIGYQVFWV